MGGIQLGLGLPLAPGKGGGLPWRNVITRTAMPITKLTNTAYQIMCKRGHYIRTSARKFKVILPHCWGSVEASPGPGQYTASLEYSGTFKQFLFGGSATATAGASAALIISDELDFGANIPKDALITINIWASIDGGFHYINGDNNTALGDRTEFGVTVADKTMGGTVAQGGAVMFSAVALLAQSNISCPLLIGDSRTAGAEPVPTGSPGDVGEIARSVGALGAPYINCGFSGGTASGFLSNGTLRKSLAAYATHIIEHFGINDITNGADGATTFARRVSIWDYFHTNYPALPIYATTIGPDSRPSNLTPIAKNADRVALNNLIRDTDLSSHGVVGKFEIADVVETARDSGLYKSGYSTDFLHLNNTGNVALRDSGIVNPAL